MEAVESREIGVNYPSPVNIFEAVKASKSGMQQAIMQTSRKESKETNEEELIQNKYHFSIWHSF